MKFFLRFSLFIAICLYASWGFTKEPTVIVISMDGIRHDLWKAEQIDSFEYIEQQGLRADHLVPVYQSTTYPGHVSLATGVHPDKHGILHNSFYDRILIFYLLISAISKSRMRYNNLKTSLRLSFLSRYAGIT